MKSQEKTKKNLGIILSSTILLLTTHSLQAQTNGIYGQEEERFSQDDLTTINQILGKDPDILISQSPDILVPNPDILIDGEPVEQQQPQYLPRAVAPPVGDISVSNIDTSPESIDLGTSALVPRLVLREAPVKTVLESLARFADMNIVFTGDESSVPPISIDLKEEPVQDVFNWLLLITDLQASRRGRTIFVGTELPQAIRNIISRSLRLNQASVGSAAAFLATQGASAQRIITEVDEVVDPITQRVVRREEQPPTIDPLTVPETEGTSGPLILQGLQVTVDDRLNSITLVGEPRKVEIASSFLAQLDARRRQVAVNVKVVDVILSNTEDFSSSFSFGIDDTFVIQDEGSALIRFGESGPAGITDTQLPTGAITNPPIIPNPFVDSNVLLDPGSITFIPASELPGSSFPDTGFFQGLGRFFNDPLQAGFSEIELELEDDGSFTLDTEQSFPSVFEFPDQFLAELEFQIVNNNAKILTDPTLVVQEGQEATVRLAEELLTSVDTSVDPETGIRTITPEMDLVGLNLTINIDRIDDNGFVTLSASPSVTAPESTIIFDSGAGAENLLTLLSFRELSTGLIRMRDNQTLILSGIIQESQQTTVSKVPLLGDLPILGTLFRSSENTNERSELIILITPQIINDSETSGFGYNYSPGAEAGEVLRRGGINIPTNR